MKSPVRPLLLAAATLVAASSAHAATQAWNTGGPTGNWNTTDTNWTGATAWTNGNDATFGGAGEAISINTTGITAHNLTFGGSGYTIGSSAPANTLTLTGTTPTIEVTNLADTATISSIIAGTVGLTKTGAGTLNLTGVNTYTGTTAVNGGTLILSPTSALTTFNFSSQNYTLSNNATLRFDLSTVGANNTWLNAGLGSTNTTGGTVELHTDSTRHGSYGSSNAALLANTTFTGSGNLNKTGTGIIDFLDTSTLATFTGAININEGMLSFQMNTAAKYSGQSTLNVAASATADVRSGILFVDALNGVVGSKVTSSHTTTKTLSVGNNGGSGSFAGVIENGSASSVAFTKNGSGTQILSGANTYTGVTTVSGGTLQLAKTASLLAANWTAAKVTVASGATLALNVGGTGEFTSANVNTLLTAISVAGAGTGLQAGAKLGFDTTNATGGTFTQGNLIANSTGANGGAIGVTKLGAGTLVLDKANTYTGATAVTAGTLKVAAATGSIQVGAAGVTVASGALLAVDGKLVLTVTTEGLIANSGTIELNSGSAVLDLNHLFDGATVGQTYNLITGGATTGGFAGFTGYSGGLNTVFDNTTGTLTFTAVPEPSTYGLIGAGVLAAVAAVRRRRKLAGKVA